jgi:DNA-binding NarL/FixJ family response regulator
VLVVDDHPIVREGIRRMVERQPDMEVSFESDNAQEALAALETTPCDFAIMDISLKGRSGIELIKDIRARRLSVPILVLSIHDDVTYAERALAAGAQGYIIKNEAPEQIVSAIHKILAGAVYVSASLQSRLLDNLLGRSRSRGRTRVSLLSDRELEVLEAVGAGKSTRDIAKALSLGVSTVATYKSRIKTKLALQNAAELATFASRWHQNP